MNTAWIIFLVLGVLTYLTRFAFVALWGRLRLPAWFQRALNFVPVAVLSAIILPELVLNEGHLNLALDNPRLLAGAAAVLVAYRTRSTLLTILAGMAVFWGMRFFLAGG